MSLHPQVRTHPVTVLHRFMVVLPLFVGNVAAQSAQDDWEAVDGWQGTDDTVIRMDDAVPADTPPDTPPADSELLEPVANEAGKPAERVVDEAAQQPLRAQPELREIEPEDDGAAVVLEGDPAAQGAALLDPRTDGDSSIDIELSDVDMFVGEVKTLGQVDLSRVAIGNGAIVRADILATGELLVIAQGPGSTSLRLWHKNGRQSDFNIRVSETDPVTRVRMERMVRMRVRLVEFRKSALGQLGINWSDDAAGPGFAIAGDATGSNLFRPEGGDIEGLPNRVAPFSTYFGIASNITSRINLLASSGDAVTLAEPVLNAMNGGRASFLAGGEVPYPTQGEDGQTTIEFKEYGVKLNVEPAIDSAGNVKTSVETEISQIDPAVSVQGAPGLLTRRAQTQVNVRSGETIVISGLLNAESSKDIERIPGIGRLPIIGRLFRSDNTRNAVSELVIFVTPEVVEPDANRLASRERRILENTDARLDEARAKLPLME